MKKPIPLTEFRAWRKKNRLSLEKLAVASGVKRQTVANWEQGRGGPQSKHIVLMSRLAPGLPTALGLIGGK